METKSKPIQKSRTLWVNIATGVASIAAHYGLELSVEEVVALFVAVNVIMRMITKGPVHLFKKDGN